MCVILIAVFLKPPVKDMTKERGNLTVLYSLSSFYHTIFFFFCRANVPLGGLLLEGSVKRKGGEQACKEMNAHCVRTPPDFLPRG